jgi:uncharacterized protein
MNMAGEQHIAASPERVWAGLNDPQVLRASIPGCQSLDKEADDRFRATVEVRIGPIGARFKGAVALTDLVPSSGYTLNLEGNGGIAGSVKGSAKVRLREDRGGTIVSYDVDAQVGGRMAQLGGPLIDVTAKQLAGKFFSRFGEKVSGVRPTEEPGRVPAATAPNPASVARSPKHTTGLPVAWILTTVVAALAGFLVGRGAGNTGSGWAGLAIGLMVVVTAAAAFEYGRRSATPIVTLDNAMLKRLIEGERE